MSEFKLTKFLLLPKLKFVDFSTSAHKSITYICETHTDEDFCPHCGAQTKTIHDKRTVRIKDAPMSGKRKYLIIKKKRFRCEMLNCKKVFTESIPGIKKGARLTERMQKEILYACENFSSLKDVRKHTSVANKTIYKRLYDQLDLEQRKRKFTPWPKTIGIDEHSFMKSKTGGYREFATIVVDYNNKRIKELIPGRLMGQLRMSLAHIPGRENVKNVAMDLSTGYRSFAREFFPNSKIIADKFHVLRLLNPTINKYRKRITGKAKKDPSRRLLLKSGVRLEHFERKALWRWLDEHPDLKELYMAKEALHKMYRCKGTKWAKRSLINLCDWLANTKVKELKTLRRTLMNRNTPTFS